MSIKSEFENEFEKQEFEILVLIQAACKGAMCIENMLRPSVEFYASVDLHSGEMFREKGRIEWLIENDKNRKGWGYDFNQYGIYRLKVRKCIPKELLHYQTAVMNNRYMLVDIIEENVMNEQLDALKMHYSKPVSIENELGTFCLDREFSCFEGGIDWNGVEVLVYLETDEEDGDTADVAMSTLNNLAKKLRECDNSYRMYAAQKLTSLANEWLSESEDEDDEEITEEVFAERMEISEVTFHSDGSISLLYLDDDMFWGHVISIDVEDDGEITDAYIAG